MRWLWPEILQFWTILPLRIDLLANNDMQKSGRQRNAIITYNRSEVYAIRDLSELRAAKYTFFRELTNSAWVILAAGAPRSSHAHFLHMRPYQLDF